jgi:hypothetical protein
MTLSSPHTQEPGLKGAAARAAEKIEMGMERATAKIKGQPAPNQQVWGTAAKGAACCVSCGHILSLPAQDTLFVLGN